MRNVLSENDLIDALQEWVLSWLSVGVVCVECGLALHGARTEVGADISTCCTGADFSRAN